MYNVMFGQPDAGFMILGTLGFDKVSDVGRFRDAWLEADGKGDFRVAVYTRNGGNNRADYMPDLKEHPLYLSDKDDTFDNTYATIYFRVPERLAAMLELLKVSPEPVDTGQRWLDAHARLNTDPEYAAECLARFDSGQFVSVQTIDPETGQSVTRTPAEAFGDIFKEET